MKFRKNKSLYHARHAYLSEPLESRLRGVHLTLSGFSCWQSDDHRPIPQTGCGDRSVQKGSTKVIEKEIARIPRASTDLNLVVPSGMTGSARIRTENQGIMSPLL